MRIGLDRIGYHHSDQADARANRQVDAVGENDHGLCQRHDHKD